MDNIINEQYKKQWLEAERNILLLDDFNVDDDINNKNIEPNLFDSWSQNDLHLDDYVIDVPLIGLIK